MFVVSTLIFLNLSFDALNRAEIEKRRIVELVKRIAQQLVLDNVDPQTNFNKDDALIGDFILKFNHSDIFRNWYIIYREPSTDEFFICAYSGERPDKTEIKTKPYIRDAFLSGKSYVKDFTLYTPLVIEREDESGKKELVTLVAKLDFGHNIKQIQATFNPIHTLIWILVLGTLLLVFTAFILLERLVIRPIDKLVEASERIAEGDYSQPIPERGGRDELSKLVSALNSMQKKLQAYTEGLKKEVKTAKEKVEKTEKHLIFAQRLSAAGTLAAGIAHEINNPLGGMINALRTLKKNNLPAEIKAQYLEVIADGLARIQETVDKILSLSIKKSMPQNIKVKELIDKAVSFVQHKIKEKNAKLEISIPEDIPDLYGDPTELLQVFLNILLNSADAIEEGKGIIKIFTNNINNELTIIIEDNGCGMSEETLNRAFDFFFTTKPPGKGTGLGLSIAHSIVNKYNGKLEIVSSENVGTKTFIRFPNKQSDTLSRT